MWVCIVLTPVMSLHCRYSAHCSARWINAYAGKLNLAKAVTYIPLPVIGGYLAFVGYFCLRSGTMLATGATVSPNCVKLLSVTVRSHIRDSTVSIIQKWSARHEPLIRHRCMTLRQQHLPAYT